jgi:sensor domain CHASE-containing protein
LTIRLKTLIIVALTSVGLIVVLYGAFRFVLLRQFIAIEGVSARENVERVRGALEDDLESIDRFNTDNAAFDETYEYMAHPREAYIRSVLGEGSTGVLAAQHLNFVAFIDNSARIVAARRSDLTSSTLTRLPDGLMAHITSGDILLKYPTTTSRVTGVILIAEGPLLIASRPIVTTNNGGPARGALLAARFLDSAEIQRLAERTNVALTAHPLDGSSLSSDMEEARAHLSTAESVYIHPLTEMLICGYILFEDIYGKPALIVRVEMPRTIYRQGHASLLYCLGTLLLSGMVFGIVIQLLLQRSVISRAP